MSSSTCAGCKQILPKRRFLTCSLCNCVYDLACANVSEKRFFNTMTTEYRQKWKCQACYCKMPKTGNMDTPAQASDCIQPVQCNSPEINNITIRKTAPTSTYHNESINSDDMSLLGDTVYHDNTETDSLSKLTLNNLSDIIRQSLQENNERIISRLQSTIQKEINNSMKLLREEFSQVVKNLNDQNNERKIEIEQLSLKIEQLTMENESMKKEIKEIATMTQRNNSSEQNCKKIVIHGFAEYYREPEIDLHNRIHGLFQELLHVDLTGYIEDTYRIGHFRSGKRPLVIELISKRMTRHILNHKDWLQNTGLSISEYLDKTARLKRKHMRDEMFSARKNGLYAVIKNDQLYIEGKIVNLEDKPHASSNSTDVTNEEKHRKKPDHDNFQENGHTFRKFRTTL